MGILPCPLPCQSDKESMSEKYEKSNSKIFVHSDSSSSSSSSNSSLYSQQSLPSVPSLNPCSNVVEQPSYDSHHCLATLRGHSSYLFSITLAGKHLYSGSSNGEIRVWNRDPYSFGDGDLVAEVHSGVKSIVVLGDKLFTAHHDHRIRVWKIDDDDVVPAHRKYKCIATLPTMNDRFMKLFAAKNYVEVRRHKKCTWVHHVDAVSALALSKDESLLYSVSWDRTFKVWRTSDFKCVDSVWNAHDDAINSVVISVKGYVYTGSADKKIKVWRLDERDNRKRHSLVATLEKHKSAVNALALSTDGTILYSGACDRSIIVWEMVGGGGGDFDTAGHMEVAGALRGHTKSILCLTVAADLVCSGSADKTVRIWRREIGKSYSCLGVFEGHKGPVKCLTATVDCSGDVVKDIETDSGKKLIVYSGSLDCEIKIWRIWVPSD